MLKCWPKNPSSDLSAPPPKKRLFGERGGGHSSSTESEVAWVSQLRRGRDYDHLGFIPGDIQTERQSVTLGLLSSSWLLRYVHMIVEGIWYTSPIKQKKSQSSPQHSRCDRHVWDVFVCACAFVCVCVRKRERRLCVCSDVSAHNGNLWSHARSTIQYNQPTLGCGQGHPQGDTGAQKVIHLKLKLVGSRIAKYKRIYPDSLKGEYMSLVTQTH